MDSYNRVVNAFFRREVEVLLDCDVLVFLDFFLLGWTANSVNSAIIVGTSVLTDVGCISPASSSITYAFRMLIRLVLVIHGRLILRGYYLLKSGDSGFIFLYVAVIVDRLRLVVVWILLEYVIVLNFVSQEQFFHKYHI